MLLYNTLTRKKEIFQPYSSTVNLYVCGITPYDEAHIGHARTYVAFDLLKRYLLFLGYNINHIQNITDVDDKILKRAKELGRNPIELAGYYHSQALQLFDQLNILRADYYPKVSEHIEDIIKFIEKIKEKGYAYETTTGIYYDVDKFLEYGKLSNQNIEEIRNVHRIKTDETKDDIIDFALWKKTRKGEEPIGWDSPFGYGRPGWHIECSVMSLKYTNNKLDIHGGAKDLIFPHHENEIAQAEVITKPFSKYWLHTGFLTINGRKMSKSLGNFITVKEALKTYSPESLRFFFLSKKYSSDIDFSDSAIKHIEQSLKRIKESINRLYGIKTIKTNLNIRKEIIKMIKSFFEALNDDLDTPRALSYVYKIISKINKKEIEDKPSIELLKLFFNQFSFIFGLSLGQHKNVELLDEIIEIRNILRKERRYDLTDKIRDILSKKHIKLLDKGDKTEYLID